MATAFSLQYLASSAVLVHMVPLLLTAPSIPGATVFAIIFGMGNGLLSIVSGTLPLALLGSDGYGKLQGKMMAARLIVSATVPFVLALGMERLGLSLLTGTNGDAGGRGHRAFWCCGLCGASGADEH